jgi:hypothetical protein
LHLGALHEGHTAHLHGAPNHSCRVTPFSRTNPFDQTPAFAQVRFAVHTGHFSQIIYFFQYAQNRWDRKQRKECGNKLSRIKREVRKTRTLTGSSNPMVMIVRENRAPHLASTGDVIKSLGIRDRQWPRHGLFSIGQNTFQIPKSRFDPKGF